MLLTFRCPPRIKEQVDRLVAAGLYPDFSGFCIAALENQLLLEETAGDRPTEPIGAAKLSGTTNPASASPRPDAPGRQLPETARRVPRQAKTGTHRPPASGSGAAVSPESPGADQRQAPAEEASSGSQTDRSTSVLSGLRLSNVVEEPPFSLPSTFVDVFQPDQVVPIDRWLFGQYNRILPAKLSIRALSVMANEGKEALVLASVAPRIAEIAARFGDYLRGLDRQFGTHRDEALATAFPEGGVEGQKGRVRYQNHFVGHMVKGEQGGILVGLKLAFIQMAKNKPYILPTSAGWEFARLVNPLLDDSNGRRPLKLSEAEIGFLLNHIKEHVPVELFAYRVVLSLVSQGQNTPELLNQHVAAFLPAGRSLDEEADLVTTQRNGALGRLGDFGLITRERQSTRIIYHLTPEGVRFIEDAGTVQAAAQTSGGTK